MPYQESTSLCILLAYISAAHSQLTSTAGLEPTREITMGFVFLRALAPFFSRLVFLRSEWLHSRVRRQSLAMMCGVDLLPHLFMWWIAATSISLHDFGRIWSSLFYRRVICIYIRLFRVGYCDGVAHPSYRDVYTRMRILHGYT